MKGVIFVIFLCVFLVGKYDRAFASVNHNPHFFVPAQDIKLTNKCQYSSFSEHHSSNNGQMFFICTDIEEEDDDTNTSSAKKYRLLNRFDISFSRTFAADQLPGTDRHSAAGDHLPGIYIIQRTLRI